MTNYLKSELSNPGTRMITVDQIKELPLDVLDKYTSDLLKKITYYEASSDKDPTPRVMDINLNRVMSCR
jgi:hypothetical protein